MQSLIEPNIHPILVHFAYALTMSGALSLFIVSLSPSGGGWRDTLKIAGDWMLAIGALTIIATVAAGFQAYYSVDHDGPSHAAMTVHRNWAVPTAFVILLLGVWRRKKRDTRPSILFAALLLAAATSLSVTAWWGGKLVFVHGLGVSRMPMVTGEGHDHEHAPGEEHGDPDAKKENEAHADHDQDTDLDRQAVDDSSDHVEIPTPANGAYPKTAEALVDAYAVALRTGDEAAIRAFLAPDVIIAEGGGAERSAEEYAGHHMPADMAFTAAVQSTLKKRDVIDGGEIATVISESQIHGEFRDQSIHSRMMETMVLKKEDDRWRIIHIHWSSAPIKGDHEH